MLNVCIKLALYFLYYVFNAILIITFFRCTLFINEHDLFTGGTRWQYLFAVIKTGDEFSSCHVRIYENT